MALRLTKPQTNGIIAPYLLHTSQNESESTCKSTWHLQQNKEQWKGPYQWSTHNSKASKKKTRMPRTLYCKQARPVVTGKKSTAPGDKNNNNSCDRINWAEQNRKALWVPSHPLSPLLANGTDRGEVLFSFSTYSFTHSTAITEPWTLLISLVCCRQTGGPVSPGYGYLSPYSQFTFLSREGSSAVRQMFN